MLTWFFVFLFDEVFGELFGELIEDRDRVLIDR